MASPVQSEASDARILIIDDEGANIQALLKLLEHGGYALCIGLTDPRKAQRQFLNFVPDLVLLDWHMEEISGAEVLHEFSNLLPAADMPPIVVLTADDSEETRHEALRLGATDFLSKPLDGSEVLLRIRNLLRMHRLHQHVQSENRRLEEKVRVRTETLRQTIAELNELQHQVIQQERLRALGTMAGGIAHDFNNALMVIRGYSEVYAQRCEIGCTPREMKKCLETIELAAADASKIVRRLTEFYRPYSKGEEDRRLVDINKIVEEALDLSRPKWEIQTQAMGIAITLQTVLQTLPQVPAAAAELREVLINLIFNAVDAMPQGGQITLRTRVEQEQVFIECEDTGTGMTRETRSRCLEPFYTTKGELGTGLGLAIIYGIVRRHHGTIRVDSEINCGTRITIVMPVGDSEQQAILDNSLGSIVTPLKVLVVDDDPLIRSIISRFLEADAHTVTLADNGCEALERFTAGEFDVVITDRVMPKMSGDQLAAAIKSIRPDEPVILLTAFETNPRPPSVDLLINKPATLHSIREAITQVAALRERQAVSIRLPLD